MGDTDYANLMSDDDGIWYWLVHGLLVGDWDDGWGYYDWRNPDKPLARFLHAVHLLNTSAPAGISTTSILYWAHDYFYDNDGDDVRPTCSTEYIGQKTWEFERGFMINLGRPFFYGNYGVPERAGTLIHEARHVDWCGHNADTSCPRQASCDIGWDYGCGFQAGEAGATQYQITYLWEFFDQGANTTTAMKHRALDRANALLAVAYLQDPCFRIGPNGDAYQLPLAACTGADASDVGTPSIVRSEEYGLSKCLAVNGGDVISTSCGSSPYWGKEWVLQNVLDTSGVPVSDGRVRIVNTQLNQCLRLSQTPTLVTQPTQITCQRVPWGTKLTTGACNDSLSEFFVTPWTPVNSSPGTYYPESWWRWRVRPALRCWSQQGNQHWDGDSCADADVYGDDVLRIFWCHDSPRQKLRAENWY